MNKVIKEGYIKMAPRDNPNFEKEKQVICDKIDKFIQFKYLFDGNK